ncbi:MAG: lysophospholipid acyltransferase family protein [Pseudomonadota bacterium]|nr:lysophospholipid acyltransferase family protein [Pseudomonadota bacterium]
MGPLRTLQLLTAVLLPALCAILWGTLLRLLGRPQQQIVLTMARTVGRLGPTLAGTPVICHQREHLGLSPAVILFNHQSGLDPVIVASLLIHPVVGIAKEELGHNPLLGPLLRLSGNLFIKRGEGWKEQLLPQAQQAVEQGFSIVIAPEGTRSRREQTGDFRLGAFAIARHCGLPVIPIVIHNSGSRLPPRSTRLRPGPVYVSVLEPGHIPAEMDLQQAAIEMKQRYDRCLAQGHPAAPQPLH